MLQFSNNNSFNISMKDKLQKYYKTLAELKSLEGISNLLEWDQEAVMPQSSVEARADKVAIIGKLMHEKSVELDHVNLVNELSDNRDQLDPIDQRSVEVTKTELEKETKLPTEFVEEFSKNKSLSQQAWYEAKMKEDFSIFLPYLEKMFEYTKQYANYVDPTKPIYDVLLDGYEEGMTTENLKVIFSDLKNNLKEILPQIKTQPSNEVFQNKDFKKHITKELIEELTAKVGFDYSRGVLGEVHHPFETKISTNDTRINTRYSELELQTSITGAIHELGHGLYEQNIDPKYAHTSLDQGVSLGIHESQSRMLENMVGRGKAFCTYAKEVLQKYYPIYKDVSVDSLVNDLNIVKPSFIRIEADEVTYNMHIILRFETELDLLNGKLEVKDLPEYWNAKMKDLLGIVPTKVSEGCLQDVHWSMALIGYFPTYTLGNLNAGQLWNSFTTKNPNYEKEFSQGNFSSYFNYFKTNVWTHGTFHKPAELIKQVTGEELNSKYFVEYLRKKYIL
jgi:carboxypeptidase Taq